MSTNNDFYHFYLFVGLTVCAFVHVTLRNSLTDFNAICTKLEIFRNPDCVLNNCVVQVPEVI